MKGKQGAFTYTPSPAIAYREIEGQILVLLPRDPELRTFNASAAFIWKRLARRTALPRIVDELAREFGIERTRAEADVLRFVRDMTRRGLLRKRRA
jgi:hypothetical protein